MGDRVTVYVRVHKDHKQAAMEICDVPDTSVWADPADTWVELEMCEVNYADISDESAELTRRGIAHTYSWGAGGEYDEGEGYVVFNEVNRPVAHSYYKADRNIPGKEILKLIHEGANIRVIERYVVQYMKKHSLPSLDDEQVKRGKIYHLRNIVTG